MNLAFGSKGNGSQNHAISKFTQTPTNISNEDIDGFDNTINGQE